MTTQVDFYLLGDNSGDASLLYACRLADKAFRLGHRVYVGAADAAQAERIDDLLWTFSQQAFVPHARQELGDGAGEDFPVLIGSGEPPTTMHDVLISLRADLPAWFERFARVAEIVGGDEAQRARGRVRYRAYREAGCTVNTHNV